MTPDTLEQCPRLKQLTCNSLSPGRTQLSIPHG